jgi:hypothetical protein
MKPIDKILLATTSAVYFFNKKQHIFIGRTLMKHIEVVTLIKTNPSVFVLQLTGDRNIMM